MCSIRTRQTIYKRICEVPFNFSHIHRKKICAAEQQCKSFFASAYANNLHEILTEKNFCLWNETNKKKERRITSGERGRLLDTHSIVMIFDALCHTAKNAQVWKMRSEHIWKYKTQKKAEQQPTHHIFYPIRFAIIFIVNTFSRWEHMPHRAK